MSIEKERIKLLNNKEVDKNGEYVLYWMQASQRVENNHALYFAIEQANILKKPIVVIFGIFGDYPEANKRHFYFMLEGLKETKEQLENLGINFYVLISEPLKAALIFEKDCSLIVVDKGYLRHQRIWRKELGEKSSKKCYEVESDLIVPVEVCSDKEEYSAATIRKKIWKNIEKFDKLPVLEEIINKQKLSITNIQIENLENIDDIIDKMRLNNEITKGIFIGGRKNAQKKLSEFLEKKIMKYGDNASDPSLNYLSELSPYIHFGQISTLEIYNAVRNIKGEGVEKFIEELVVRRELAYNFVYYNVNYDNYNYVTYSWAYDTLNKHLDDERKYIYKIEDFENGKTHDKYWNSAQLEMVYTGKMHGYMRMYWAKKILEWSKNPEEAYKITIYLNNKYFIDGRDANGYAGVAWCYGKHDRAWSERDIFGKIRYMNANGLERKFEIDNYVIKVNEIIKGAKK